MKSSTSPPHSLSQYKDNGDNNEEYIGKYNDERKCSSEKKNNKKGANDNDGSKYWDESESKENNTPVKILPPRALLTPLSIDPALVSIIKWWGYPSMQTLYEKDISINPSNGKPQRGIYLERKIITIGMYEMSVFDARFRYYYFEWMTMALG